MYPIEISSIKERFFRQAFETLYDNLYKVNRADTINAFNKRIDRSGFSPTLTTRPDGFKTAVLVIEVRNDNRNVLSK